MLELKRAACFILLSALCVAFCFADNTDTEWNIVSDRDGFKIHIFYVLSDSGNDASVAAIAERFKRGEAERKQGSVYSSGYSERNSWLAVNITNAESISKDMVFEVGDPHINRLELFKIADNIESLGAAGDLNYFYARVIADNNFVFRFTLKPLERCTLLLKIDNKGHTTMMPFKVNTFAVHYSSTVTEYLVWGLLTGVLLFVCVFLLLIYFFLKERLFLFYALYIFVTLMWIWSNNGLGYQFLYPDFPHVMARIRFVAAAFGITLMLQVMQLFTRQARDNSYFFRATNVVKAGLSVMALILFIPYDYTNDKILITVFLVVSDMLVLGAILLLFAGLIEKIRQGQRATYIYLAAISVFFVAGILTLLVRLGVIPASTLSLNGVYISIMIEILILSFALGQRYNALKKEEQRLQVEIENQKKDAAHKIEMAAVRERSRIAADLHDDIGSGISGLRLFSEMAGRKNSIEELKSDTHKIAENAAVLADKISEVVWTLDAENRSLESFLLYIQKHGMHFFERSGIVFSMDIPIQLPDISLNTAQQKHLLLAVKEIFNNALKHSGATRLDCSIVMDTYLIFVICDNGKGFNSALPGNGNGLINIQNRIVSINGSMEVKSDAGTTFTIRIPMKGQHTPNG